MAEDSFESSIPAEHFELVLDVASSRGIDPTASVELERYFAGAVLRVRERGDDLRQRLAFQIKRDFRSVAGDPRWIQNPNWQVAGGMPMVFIGQIDVPAVSGLFHDAATFYVFWDPPSGEVRSIVQVA